LKVPWKKWFVKGALPGVGGDAPILEEERIVTLMVAPKFDRLTTIFSQWVKDLAGSVTGIVVLEGDQASSELFSQALHQTATDRVIVVFFGHGWFDSLLTAPHLGFGAERFDGKHSRLCIASSFDSVTNLTVIAFCCKAARELGRLLGSRQATFLGFGGDLKFVIGTKTREASFAAPICALVRSVLVNGRVTDEDVVALSAAYEAESLRWISGDMADDPRAMLISAFLDEQRTAFVANLAKANQLDDSSQWN